MSFVDFVRFHVRAGHGGKGAVSFRREKFVEFGGPNGGDGGRGGDVIAVADENVGTLLDFRYQKHIHADDGRPGDKNNCTGKSGAPVRLRVPVGTIIRDAATLELIADLTEAGDEIVIATGGAGGRGNSRFKSSTRQVPKYAQDGLPGDELDIVLELKLLADIGIIGYPSVGKSTLISVISNARPKIADYHFTTLTPNLGIVKGRDHKSWVVADIPGLIEGAHEGHGLGHQFLRHVERCRALVHVIEITMPWEGADDGRDPIRDFDVISGELAHFSDALADRPQIVALAKSDLPWVAEQVDELRAHFEEQGHKFLVFSSVTRDGLQQLVDAMELLVTSTPAPEPAEFTRPEAWSSEPTPSDEELQINPADDPQFAALRNLIADEDAQLEEWIRTRYDED